MILLAATLLILCIAAFQATQGTFSALITLMLTVLSLAVAFNYYEPLAVSLYETQPAYADAVALLVLFFLSLLVLRNLADWLIRNDVRVGSDMTGVWLSRGIAGVFGLFTGILLVGVLTTAMQLMPWGRSVLGYEPFDTSLQRTGSLWPFCPDRVTVALARGLSAGSLSGERPYADHHDDLLREAYCRRNTAELHGRVEAPPDSLLIERVVDVTDHVGKPKAEGEPLFADGIVLPPKLFDPVEHPILSELDAGKRYLCVVARIDRSARAERPDDDEDDDKKDRPIYWRLVGTHFRLLCGTGDDAVSRYPLAGEPLAVLNEDGDALGMQGVLGPVYPAQRDAETDRWDRARLAVLAKYARVKEGSMRAVRVAWIYAVEDTVTAYRTLTFRGVAAHGVPEVVKPGSPPGEDPDDGE
ncbi:MAG: CvpA family protein [Phycisphaerae bacterium]|nr:CvpA family protein [Phycisphaerae bacterium]